VGSIPTGCYGGKVRILTGEWGDESLKWCPAEKCMVSRKQSLAIITDLLGEDMEDLIKALCIFAKYDPPKNPTLCEHGILIVFVDPKVVSIEDRARLDDLSFGIEVASDKYFVSYRFGSA